MIEEISIFEIGIFFLLFLIFVLLWYQNEELRKISMQFPKLRGLPRMQNPPPPPPRRNNVHQPIVDRTREPPKKDKFEKFNSNEKFNPNQKCCGDCVYFAVKFSDRCLINNPKLITPACENFLEIPF